MVNKKKDRARKDDIDVQELIEFFERQKEFVKEMMKKHGITEEEMEEAKREMRNTPLDD